MFDVLSKAELLALLRAARDKSARDWLMIVVTYTHGLRVSETLALTGENIVGDYIDVQRLKGSDRTKQPLLDNPDPLLDERAAVLELVRNQARNQKLFPMSRWTFNRRMEAFAIAAGVPLHKAHAHALKHSCGTQTIDTAGIHRTQAWLGHKSMGSTGVYLNPTAESVAAAVHRAMKKPDGD